MKTNMSFDAALDETLRHADELRACGRQITVENLRALADRDEMLPPDPYREGIAALQQKHASPMSPAEARYRIERAIEVDRERIRAEKASPASTSGPRLTAAELASYVPPDPYADGIRLLQELNRGHR